MTSAKPHSMAAQTDAPDDLIAELARLMADDARADQPAKAESPAAKPASVRIPGAEAPAVTPAGAAPRAETPAAPIIRIPGVSVEAPPAASAEPFRFDFDLGLNGRAAGPATPLPATAETIVEPVPAAPADTAPLDHNALADLIAAELANDLAPAEPVPAVSGPARGEDNFGVPPVFGLGAPVAREPVAAAPEPVAVEPEPVVPSPEPVEEPAPMVADEPAMAMSEPPGAPEESDALTEIERLVGPVVHKAQEDAGAMRPPSAALRSLATPTLPVSDPEPELPPAPQTEPASVDDAILAAAAATGARVEWVDSMHAGEESAPDDMAAYAPLPRRGLRFSRAVVGPVVAVGLLAVAGLGLYWVLGQGGAPAGPAPLLVADNAVIKEVPQPAEEAGQQSVVFNEISGNANIAEEQIVARDQADEVALAEAATPSINTGILAGDDGAVIDPNQDGLVNRKVRTVTVRPDGTIISGDDSMAGTSILPVERPNVPEVPGADFSTPDLIASTIAATEATPTPAATTPAVTPVTPGSTVPVVDASGAAISGRSVTVPMNKPDDFAQAAAAALSAAALPPTGTAEPAATAPAQPAATQPAAIQPVAVTSGGAASYVQLASQRSEDAARQSAQSMMTRFGVLFGGANPEIQRVDLGERGIYYRVLVPTASRADAANICTNIKAAGGDCLIP